MLRNLYGLTVRPGWQGTEDLTGHSYFPFSSPHSMCALTQSMTWYKYLVPRPSSPPEIFFLSFFLFPSLPRSAAVDFTHISIFTFFTYFTNPHQPSPTLTNPHPPSPPQYQPPYLEAFQKPLLQARLPNMPIAGLGPSVCPGGRPSLTVNLKSLTPTHAYTHPQTHTYTHPQTHTYTHTHTRIHTLSHTYTYTKT